MIPHHRPSTEWSQILHGSIMRAADRLSVTPESIALALAHYVDGETDERMLKLFIELYEPEGTEKR
jgi:hypothetical protein